MKKTLSATALFRCDSSFRSHQLLYSLSSKYRPLLSSFLLPSAIHDSRLLVVGRSVRAPCGKRSLTTLIHRYFISKALQWLNVFLNIRCCQISILASCSLSNSKLRLSSSNNNSNNRIPHTSPCRTFLTRLACGNRFSICNSIVLEQMTYHSSTLLHK